MSLGQENAISEGKVHTMSLDLDAEPGECIESIEVFVEVRGLALLVSLLGH